MKRLALFPAFLLCVATPSFAADLDGPVYRDRETYIERPAPPVVVERRIIEHHYYYAEPHEYVPPRVYAPYAWNDAYYDGAYGYRFRRHAYYAGGRFWRHRRFHGGW